VQKKLLQKLKPVHNPTEFIVNLIPARGYVDKTYQVMENIYADISTLRAGHPPDVVRRSRIAT
jgi:hypothetical protein